MYLEKSLIKNLNIGEDNKSERLYVSIVYGKYGSGKTEVVLNFKKFIKTSAIYFLVTQKDPKLLTFDWYKELKRNFDYIKIPENIISISELIFSTMISSTDKPLTLIIDDFDKLLKVDKSSFDKIIYFIKKYRNISKMHIIITTSNKNIIPIIPYDNIINIENIGNKKNFSKDIYYLTGGLYKFARYLNDKKLTELDDILKEIISKDSYIIAEIENYIKDTLGKNNSTYQAILQLIAIGKNTFKKELTNFLGREVSGFITKLEKDYNFIRSYKCLTTKRFKKNYIYEINSNILLFYYRYIFANSYLIQQGRFSELIKKIKLDYSNFLLRVKLLNLINRLEETLPEYEVGKIILKDLKFIPLIGAINNDKKKLKIYIYKKFKEEFKKYYLEVKKLYNDFEIILKFFC